jgi:hypothetical protein
MELGEGSRELRGNRSLLILQFRASHSRKSCTNVASNFHDGRQPSLESPAPTIARGRVDSPLGRA